TKLFNDTMTQINNTKKELSTTVQNLMKEATDWQNNNLKQQAQDLKDSQAAIKDSMDVSKRSAPGLAAALDQFKTDQDKADFINKFAEENGIDPAVLWGDVTNAMTAKQKAEL